MFGIETCSKKGHKPVSGLGPKSWPVVAVESRAKKRRKVPQTPPKKKRKKKLCFAKLLINLHPWVGRLKYFSCVCEC